ncbi:Innexin family-containing protein [Strongyloides ratti]|uniref:Innexin n=1 Tax=Strongyloides ratti TaxID=34506 RepID=A0A090MYS8_STRRB|nr:Innexin family-containing protein [Strongyloides ratti]CEF67709.1 Innexin family-containing protein [Strongyloides ratti]
MLTLPDIVKDYTALASDVIDDHFDRINCAYSVWILMFAVIATTTAVYDKPIQCFHKLDHPENWVQGLNNICYANGTYAIPNFNIFFKAFTENGNFDYQRNDDILKLVKEYDGFSINYYQWIPYALLLQSFAYFIPKIIWNVIVNSMTFDVRSLLNKVGEMNKLGATITDEQGDGVIAHIYNFLEYSLDLHLFSKESIKNSVLAMGQLLVKALYVINGLGQFYFMNFFVANGNHLWAFEHLFELFVMYPNPPQKYFPYNAICNTGYFKETYISNINIQCVLSMNMINSYIYLILYFWTIFVIFMSFYSFIRTLLCFFNLEIRRNILVKWLKNNNSIKGITKYSLSFAKDVIKHDGFVLFSLMKQNSGKRVTFSVLRKIWETSIGELNDEIGKNYGDALRKEAKIVKRKI